MGFCRQQYWSGLPLPTPGILSAFLSRAYYASLNPTRTRMHKEMKQNPMGRGAWWAIVCGATKTWTWLSDWAHTQEWWNCPFWVQILDWLTYTNNSHLLHSHSTISSPWQKKNMSDQELLPHRNKLFLDEIFSCAYFLKILKGFKCLLCDNFE